MQLLAKFKKILYLEFRATLNFRKFKVALNPSWKVLETVMNHLKVVRIIKLLSQSTSHTRKSLYRKDSSTGQAGSLKYIVNLINFQDINSSATFTSIDSVDKSKIYLLCGFDL